MDLFVRPADVEITLEHSPTSAMRLSYAIRIGSARFIANETLSTLFSVRETASAPSTMAGSNMQWRTSIRRTGELRPPEEMIWAKAFVMEQEARRRRCRASYSCLRAHDSTGAGCWSVSDPHWRVRLATRAIRFHLSVGTLLVPFPDNGIADGPAAKGKIDPLSRNRVCRGTLSRTQYRDDVES